MASLKNSDMAGHAFGQNPDTRTSDKVNLPLPPKGGEGLTASFVRPVCPTVTTGFEVGRSSASAPSLSGRTHHLLRVLEITLASPFLDEVGSFGCDAERIIA